MSTPMSTFTSVRRPPRHGTVSVPGARIVGLRRVPLRRPQNPVDACPILGRLGTAPEEPTRRGARVSAVLLLLLLLL